MSSREHYRGGHKCLPGQTTGGTLRFFLCFSLSLMEGRGDTCILKKISLRKPTRKNFKNLGGKGAVM